MSTTVQRASASDPTRAGDSTGEVFSEGHGCLENPGGAMRMGDVTRATKIARSTHDAPTSPSRRKILAGGAVAGAALLLSSSRVFAIEPEQEIRLGFISPRSGAFGLFGESDPYILGLVRKALANGISHDGRRYKVTIFDRDSQSSPSRASQLAHELIDEQKIHLMLVASTPETVNPVSDACEAAGVPSIGTTCPLESFFFGRGGKLGHPSPFKWSFDFNFGVAQFVTMYVSQWSQLKTNKKVAGLYPNDADGTAYRRDVVPALEKHGYKVIDPGPYEDGTSDYSTQIALFNRENCQIFTNIALRPDFNAFLRQAAQLNYLKKVVIAQLSKTGEFPGEIISLGPLGRGLSIGVYWSPVYPYKSPSTGLTSRPLASGYENATGRQWTMQLGASLSLFDVALAVLNGSRDPTNRSAIRDVVPELDITTIVGRVNFKAGPYPNTATTAIVGAQWEKTSPGSRFPVDPVVVEHVEDTRIPIQSRLRPYNI